MKELRKKINSLILYLMAHPDNVKNSETADRLEDVVEIEKMFSNLYTKEDVETLITNYAETWGALSSKSDIEDFNEWIEKNLK